MPRPTLSAPTIARGHDLRAQILQLGHHGSRHLPPASSSRPSARRSAFYSAGVDNQFGHPHQEVVDRVLSKGINLYGTAEHGTVVVATDGQTYEVRTERGIGPRVPPAATEAAPPAAAATATPSSAPVGGACQPGKVNINTASAQELTRIIHIGEARDQDIIAKRPLSSVDDLTRVTGIAAARLADIKVQGLACAG